MPGPFPGVDPFLERSEFWRGFHNRLIGDIADELQPRLPENYVAVVEVRVYLETAPGPESRTGRARIPDAEVVRTGPSAEKLAVPAAQRLRFEGHYVPLDAVETREAYVVIRNVGTGELVTCIELLSPSNKRPGEGRDQYRIKQNDMVVGGVNLVEVDLLRGGLHTVLAPADRVAELPPFHYLASVYRVSDALRVQVFTWTLREKLPHVPIPLAPDEDELELDLGSLFHRRFEKGAFARLLRDDGDPDPALAPEDAAWADALLRVAGLRETPGA